MLNNLPLEVIINITIFLEFRDKLTLSLTSRKLRLIIWSRILFQRLSLDNDSYEKQRSTLEDFRNEKTYGHQVRQLMISSSQLPDDVFRDLALVFPNVTDLGERNSGLTSLQKTEKSNDILNKIVPWKDTLKRIYTDNDYSQLFTLVEKNVFSKLKYLSISPYKRYNLVEKPQVNLVQCLTNTPSLEDLRLFNMTVTIKFLEELHTCLPRLQTLTLESLIVNTKNDANFSSVEPVTHLLSLEIEDDVLICDEQCLFLDYIITKYRNLVKLTLISTLDLDGKNLDLSSCYFWKERYFNLSSLEDIASNIVILDALKNSHDITQNAYTKGGSKRLLKFPSTLKVLKLNTNIFEDLAETLKKVDIQPKTLDLDSMSSGKVIAQSLPEIQYFEKWSSLTTLDIAMPNDFNPGSKHLISTSVTTLRLTLSDQAFQKDYFIDCILFSFPCVSSLSIKSAFYDTLFFILLLTERDYSAPEVLYPNLRSLNVDCTLIDIRVSAFLQHCVPNLQEIKVNFIANRLTFQLQIESRFAAHIINLNSVKLDRLNIDFQFKQDLLYHSSEDRNYDAVKDLGYLLVQNRNQSQSDKYTFRKGTHQGYVDFSLVDDIEVDDLNDRVQIVLFHAGTVKNICIGDYTVH